MHLLGRHLPDHQLIGYALKAFYGLSHHTSRRLLARISIPERALVSELTETQITALSGFLSSPSTAPRAASTPLAPPLFGAAAASSSRVPHPSDAELQAAILADPLNTLLIESDLRRSRNADIAHHRQIGTYRGRRHAMALPVRGQNTRTNAHTAKRLNRLVRRAYR
jgi:small subunit ribosomal protein S13